MEARIDPVLLWSRAAGVGLVGFLLGTIGHVLADGLLPGPATLTALLLFSVLVSAPMLARQASVPQLVLMIVSGQTMVHLALTLTAGHRGDAAAAGQRATAIGTSPPAGATPTLPTLDGHRVGSLQDAYQGVIASPGSNAPVLPVGHLINDMHAHAAMMVAHLVAAALVGVWLGYGERCLWTLLALTGRQVTAALRIIEPAPPTPPPASAATTWTTPQRPTDRWRSQPRSRRGPPLPAC